MADLSVGTLRDNVSSQIVSDSVTMSKSHPVMKGKLTVLVEGLDDKIFYQYFFNDNVDIQPNEGCLHLKEAHDDLQSKGEQHIAILDSDFCVISGEILEDENCFVTDKHDLEMTCFNFPELREKFMRKLGYEYDEVKYSELFEDLKLLSYFKWSEHLQPSKKLKLKEIKVSNGKDYLNDYDRILADALRMSKAECRTRTFSKQDLVNFMRAHVADAYDVTVGHDFLNYLAMKYPARPLLNNLNDKMAFSFMMMLFTEEMFKQTHLYSKIRDWELRNGIQVLAMAS